MDFNSCDDFFKIVVSSYLAAAAMSLLNITDFESEPDHTALIKDDDWLQDVDSRKDTLYGVASAIVSRFFDLDTELTAVNAADDDKKLEYSKLVISLGLLYFEFCDAIKEGDGIRVLRCWRYMLLLFKCTDRVNYSIEAFTMLAQYHFLFSQRQAHQLLWSRFINVHGLPSQNIPCDLFMEHLNRVCKDAVRGLGANKTPQALVKIGRVVGILDNVMINFDEDNMVKQQSGRHEVANFRKDMITVVKVLINEELLVYKPHRKHETFGSVDRNPIQGIDHEQLLSWMYIQLNHLIHGF